MAVNILLTLEEMVTAVTGLTAEIDQTGASLRAGMAELSEAMRAFRPCECPVGEMIEPEDTTEGSPPPEGFEEYDPLIDERKCKLANMVYDDVLDITKKLKALGVEQSATLGLASTIGAISAGLALIAAGPLGWGMAILGAITGLAKQFFTSPPNLDNLITLMEDPTAHEDIVNAIYNAANNAAAHAEMKAAFSAHGADSLHLLYLDALKLINGLTAVFFQPDGEHGVLINQRLDGYVGAIECETILEPTDWIIIPQGGGFTYTTASGTYGTGVIDQTPGAQWTITAEERTDFPGQYVLGLVIRDWWDTNKFNFLNTPVNVLVGDGLQSHSGSFPNPLQNYGRSWTSCAGPMVNDVPGYAVPNSYGDRGMMLWICDVPFSVTFSIVSPPTGCP